MDLLASIGACGLGLCSLGQGPAVGSYEHSDRSCSVNGRSFLDNLGDY
jgi:hypothetical protein